jgi:hypothetical protein
MRKIVAIDQNEKPGKYSNAASKMMPDGGMGFSVGFTRNE